jgi:hypothetical protein
MADGDRTEALLVEIRDAQRELLAEYRRVANEALRLQHEADERQRQAIAQQGRAVDVQARVARMARISVMVIAPLIAVLVWLLVRVSRPYLG